MGEMRGFVMMRSPRPFVDAMVVPGAEGNVRPPYERCTGGVGVRGVPVLSHSRVGHDAAALVRRLRGTSKGVVNYDESGNHPGGDGPARVGRYAGERVSGAIRRRHRRDSG